MRYLRPNRPGPYRGRSAGGQVHASRFTSARGKMVCRSGKKCALFLSCFPRNYLINDMENQYMLEVSIRDNLSSISRNSSGKLCGDYLYYSPQYCGE